MKKVFKTIITTTAILAAFFSASFVQALEFTSNLSLGVTGSEVTELQECLIAMDYELPNFGADGSFGNETVEAVKAYQQENGLVVDGIVGKQTATAMDCLPSVEYQEADVDDVDFQRGDNVINIDISGDVTETCSAVVQKPVVVFNKEDSVFTITVKESVPAESTECVDSEDEYELEAQIDISELASGEYTVVVQNKEDFYFAIEKTELLGLKEPESQELSNTSAEAVSSSYEAQKRDTAVFTFKMNLSPLDNPIYVPAVAEASVDVAIFNANDEMIEDVTYDITVRSEAEKVEGVDGNVYYKVDEPRTFIYSASTAPGAGAYYGQLIYVSFTSQDVTSRSYTGFSGLTLEVEPETWTTKTIELDA